MNETDIFDPFRKLRKAEEKMRRMIDADFLEPGMREPLVDIIDRGKEIRVVAELPGAEKKDIELKVQNSIITISAKTGFEKKEKNKAQGYLYHERTLQSFHRTIPMPMEVVSGKALAEFKNGILSVTMPKKYNAEKQKGKKIEIK